MEPSQAPALLSRQQVQRGSHLYSCIFSSPQSRSIVLVVNGFSAVPGYGLGVMDGAGQI